MHRRLHRARPLAAGLWLVGLAGPGAPGCGRVGRCEVEPHVTVPFPECEAPEDGIVVEDGAAFEQLCGSEAVDESFDAIDFDAMVVLGLRASGSGCTIDFDERVCRDDDASTLTYEITVTSRGTCDKAAARNGWVAVERPPASWGFAFDVRGR